MTRRADLVTMLFARDASDEVLHEAIVGALNAMDDRKLAIYHAETLRRIHAAAESIRGAI